MKKYFLALVAVSSLLVAAGCSGDKEQEVSCTVSKNDTVNGYSLESTYDIYATNDVVKTVKTKEVVTSDKEEVRSLFEKQFKTTYEKMDKEYGGYDVKITNKDNKVTSDVTIDYTKVNLKKLTKDEPSMKNIMTDDKEFTLEGIKQLYESMGAICEEK